MLNDAVKTAFAKPVVEGVLEGPRGHGRRVYDQTFWWVRAVKDVGFPIVAAWWVATQLVPLINDLREATERNTKVVTVVLCKVDPPACSKAIQETP